MPHQYPWDALYPYSGDMSDEESALEQKLRESRAFRSSRPAEEPTEAQFGRAVTVTRDDNGKRKGLLQVRLGRVCPWVVSIDHSPIGFNPNVGNTAVDQQASFITARWGAGGAAHEAQIDVRNGSSFVVFGSFVELSATIAFPTGLLGGQVDPITFRTSAVPVSGSLPAMGFATRSILLFDGALPIGTPSNAFLIPPYAADWQLTFNGAAAQGANVDRDVQFQNQAGAGTGFFPIRTSANRSSWDSSDWLPVPYEASTVSVLNASGTTNLTRPVIVFRLNLA